MINDLDVLTCCYFDDKTMLVLNISMKTDKHCCFDDLLTEEQIETLV